MKNKTKTFGLSLLLPLLLIATACGDEAQTVDTGDVTTAGAVTETGDASGTEISYDPGLPEWSCDGATFTFAVRGNGVDDGEYGTVSDIMREETDGDVLNDAIYKKSSEIEETYHVNLEVFYCGNYTWFDGSGDVFSKVQTSVLADDNAYQAIGGSTWETMSLAANGYLHNLSDLNYLNLSKPWWDQNALSATTIGDKIYYAAGDILLGNMKSPMCILFNKQLVLDSDLESPYDLVNAGTWTLDKMMDMAKQVTNDVNGDGVYTEEDRLGFAYWQDSVYGLLNGCDIRIAEINQKNEFTLSLYSDKTIAFWDKLMDFANTDTALNLCNEMQVLDFNSMSCVGVHEYVLSGNHALFCWGIVEYAQQLRGMDVDFGIVPTPKFDETQESYKAGMFAFSGAYVGVPITNDDLDTAGIILEALAAKSAEEVSPAYFDKCLIGKSVRDEESKAMLDIIFANRIYDIGYFHNFGNVTQSLMDWYNQKNENFVSSYEKLTDKATKDIEKLNEMYAEIEA